MQKPSRIHLRPQHRINPTRRQRTNHTVIQHTSRMHNRNQIIHPSQNRRKSIAVPHITRSDGDLSTTPNQLSPQLSRPRSSQTPTTKQQQPTSTHRNKMTGNNRTKAPSTTSNQHRAIQIPTHHRHSQNNLPNMPGTTHITKRIPSPPHIPNTNRQRLQHALIKQLN